ncbi:methyl-accepting chemotaxis protein [Sphingomonas sp. RB3P16]|uniref:methyl-accepting chemotaxis protein n=1 Tax=Parasphingomonas frigoris TaxID=3096163 RepID=UPI002FC5DFC5
MGTAVLLALLTPLCDWRAIAIAAASLLLLHLGLALYAPEWGLAGVSLDRIAIQAALLIVETATLLWFTRQIDALAATSAREAAERESRQAERADAHSLQSEAVAMVAASLGHALEALSEGDLTTRITVDYPGGYGALKSDFNVALGALRRLIGSVGEGASGMRGTSVEIARASEALARRTHDGAARLRSVSATLAGVDACLRANSAATAATVTRADQAKAAVVAGRGMIDAAVRAIARVTASAERTDRVIAALDKMAVQTRLLAMNAAVEAGRAGEAGRSFAAVANLIADLSVRVEAEVRRARDPSRATQVDIAAAVEAVRALDQRVAVAALKIEDVRTALSAVASDSKTQSRIVTDLSALLTMMDEATQRNAAMVAETSAAARSLTSEVSALANEAKLFRVGGGAPKQPVHFRPSPETVAARAMKSKKRRPPASS